MAALRDSSVSMREDAMTESDTPMRDADNREGGTDEFGTKARNPQSTASGPRLYWGTPPHSQNEDFHIQSPPSPPAPASQIRKQTPLFLPDSRAPTPYIGQGFRETPFADDWESPSFDPPPPPKRRRLESEPREQDDDAEEEEEEEEEEKGDEEEDEDEEEYMQSFRQAASHSEARDVRRFLDVEAEEAGMSEDSDDEESQADRDFLDDSENINPIDTTTPEPEPLSAAPSSTIDDAMERRIQEVIASRAAQYRKETLAEMGQYHGWTVVREETVTREVLIHHQPLVHTATPAPRPQAAVDQNHHNGRALAAYRSQHAPLDPRLPRKLALASVEATNPLKKGDWVRLGWGKDKGRLAFVITDNTLLAPGRKPPVFRITKARHRVHLIQPLDFQAATRDAPIVPYQGLLQQVTYQELQPFARSNHIELRRLVHTDPSPALRPGDRVVVVSGEYKGQSGFIARLKFNKGEGKEYARVIPAYDGEYVPDSLEAGIYLEATDLRRHALDFSFAFQVGDRARTVDGKEAGRVKSFDCYGTQVVLERDALGNYPTHLLDDLVRVWEVGDVVRVRWGNHEGRAGYLVKADERNGMVELYDLDRIDGTGRPNRWEEERVFRVRAVDIDFDTIGDTVSYAPVVNPVHERGADIHFNVDGDRLISPPQGLNVVNARTDPTAHYIGLGVLVVAAGAMKGFRGTVTGVYNSQDRANRLRRLEQHWADIRSQEERSPTAKGLTERLRGIDIGAQNALAKAEKVHEGLLLTIRKAQAGETVQHIRIEDVVHERTMVPLLKTRGMLDRILRGNQVLETTQQHLGLFPPLPPPPRPVTPCPTPTNEPLWGADSLKPKLDGEEDGEWLCIPGLAMKRLDVIVVGVAEVETLAQKVRELEGKRGYILVEEDIPSRGPKKRVLKKIKKADKIDVYGATVGGLKHPLERKYVRPCRTADDGRLLTEVMERVVVVGADVNHDVGQRGCYGFTAPHIGHLHGFEVVAVDFGQGRHEFFHISSLCWAKNQSIALRDKVFNVTTLEK
ncbi:hypothetical protein R3P38DRAFT_3244748 [Favolaschia claudopus]|uniref:KOW domain-containing protein n=1 Tax=Favolaschia claudopus TaxID=2862362 RepID=A0AAV9Z169_9AGAR